MDSKRMIYFYRVMAKKREIWRTEMQIMSHWLDQVEWDLPTPPPIKYYNQDKAQHTALLES